MSATSATLDQPLTLNGSSTLFGFDGVNARRVLIRVRSPHADDPAVDRDAALVASSEDIGVAQKRGFHTVVTIGDAPAVQGASIRRISLPASFGYLGDGDILGVELRSRRVRTLYRRRSSHNAFLVTERCNNYCLMCPQPPRDVDDGWILDEIAEALPLVDPATRSIGFTGGEPLLDWKPFTGVLALTKSVLPNTRVHVLTNGRAFSRREVTAAWKAVGHPDLCAGIPLYSSAAPVHDHVVQAAGAFEETLMGILRLKDAGQKVEIRIVLHKLTAPGLVETCGWIARNLPFVNHVALMGLENTGFALANQADLWIDPVDYRADLSSGVQRLLTAGLNVSVYNLPRCVLDRSVWPVAVQSISDWKNAFPAECSTCVERPSCGGFFSTGRPRLSRGVTPLLGMPLPAHVD